MERPAGLPHQHSICGYNGGATNLSAIRNLAYDPDPAVRKAAYEAELACYDKIKDPVAFALNSIKLETIYAAQLPGLRVSSGQGSEGRPDAAGHPGRHVRRH